jgi:hypothetical protein
MGHPCARIRNSIAQGTNSLESAKLKKAGSQFSSDEKISEEETVWFALDTRKVMRISREITIQVKADAASVGLLFNGIASGGSSGGSAPGGAPSGGPAGAPGGPSGYGAPGGAPGSRADWRNSIVGSLLQRGLGGGRPGMQGPGGPGGVPGGIPGGPGGGRGAGGPVVQQQAFLQIKLLTTLTLER